MGDGKKILVVDDEPEILDVMGEILSHLGYDLLLAHDGRQALQLFHAEQPPLVITDIRMPEMDGLTLLKAIKEASPTTEVLIVTGHADLTSAIEAVRRGAFDYLQKPFDLEQIRRSVDLALERNRLVTENEALLRELEERVQAQTQALVESRRQLQAVFDGINDSLVIVDQTFAIVAANQGAAALSGVPAPALIGRTCYREFFGREEICPGCPVLKTLTTGKPVSVSMSRWNPDGSRTYLEVSGYPLAYEGDLPAGPAGRPMEAIEHVRDVTEQLRQRRHLHNSEKLVAVGQLAAGLAHELGNALAIIGGSVQFLLRYGADRWPEAREYLEAVKRNVASADRTLRGLLAFARPREPSLDLVDVTTLLEQVCLLLKGEFAKLHVKIVKQYAPDLPRIAADGELLQQVFLNLLLNAVQAMDEGGKISMVTAPDFSDVKESWVRVEITDTGRGIPREYLDRIFDPFFTTKNGGTGLGLSVAYRHILAHRGRMTVESQEGKGTRFVILLPAASEAA